MLNQKKQLDPESQKLAAEFRDEIAHNYSQEFTERMSYITENTLLTFFTAKHLTAGIEHLTSIPKNVPVILSSVHKSHLDYMILGQIFFNFQSKLPATIAGKNLFHGPFQKILPMFKGVCLDRDRVNPKNLRSKENLLYLSTFYSYLMSEVVAMGDAITIFPEGGRSYDGSIQPLSLGIFGIAKRALKEHEKVALIPIGITYDRVTEDARFAGLLKYKERSERAYRSYDKRGFYHHAFLQPKGNVYIDFGEPLYLTDIRHMDTLEQDLRRQMGELIRVTPVSLVARAIGGKREVFLDDVFRHIQNDMRVVRENNLLIGKGIRYRPASRIFKRSLEHLCNRMRFRDVFRIESRPEGSVLRVRRPDIIAYNANTVSHLFPNSEIIPLL